MFSPKAVSRASLTLLFVLLVSSTLTISTLGQARSRSKAKRNAKPAGDLPSAPSLVADVSLTLLPPKYVGDNAGPIYQRLAALRSRLRKSQFETTAEFQSRVSLLLNEIKIGPGRTANDRLTFVHWYGDESYDADTQVFTLKPDINYEAGVGYEVPQLPNDVRSLGGNRSIDLTRTAQNVATRIGRTAFGIRKRIKVRAYSALRLVMSESRMHGWSEGLRFRVPPAMARQASGRVWLAVTGRLAYPFVVSESDVDNATLSDPEEAHSFHFYVFFVPDSLVLYNISTGQIYGSWDLTHMRSTTDRIATPIGLAPAVIPTKPSEKTLISRPRILSKPEPQYTEEARKNQITGVVVLSAVFSETGELTEIKVMNGLSHGLTERAIEAAKLIKFVPAESNGKKIPFRIVLEYYFNLY